MEKRSVGTYMKLSRRPTTRLFLLVLLFFAGLDAPCAWAVQAHGGAEGLVSHQIGHILFITGMAYLLSRVHQNQTTRPGWPEFKGFLVFIILWNCITFTGHWLNEIVDPAKYVKVDGQTVGYTITNFTDFVFYFSRLDHLLLVPSFFLLMMALKKWRRTS